jgi:periplasmic mercuric ion binding protein
MRFFLSVLVLCSAMAFADDGHSIRVSIKGMVCNFCAQGLKKVFAQEKVIEGISVSLERRQLLFTLRAGTSLDDARIIERVKDAGYEVEKIER